jgi:hypothetical protein
MFRRISLATAFALLATVQAASAFMTAPLQGSTDRWFSCRVLNTDNVAHDVTIKVIQANTGVVKLSKTISIGPATTRSTWGYADSIAYCEVTGIARRSARTTFCLENNWGNCLSLVTVP